FNGKIFGDEEALEILSQLLEILSYLHKAHNNRYPVIHRDLRLSNVFWFQNKAYIVDFGMARYLKEKVSQSERPLKRTVLNIDRHRPGKKTYSALRAQVSPSSDLFGAGVVTLDLFANWIKDETQFKRPWQEIFPGSSRLKSFIEHLLLPEVQFPSARDALNSLEKIKDIKKPCD
ncbi:MAG: Serine/threonine-protein kinase-like domain protein, partial [Deltaproteobacteria bacterium]|nr:Serine/threonine-protein kinase-like domain protein [Deltaproteobacteria bacterium]